MPSISYEIYRCFTGQVFYSINHELLRYKRRTMNPSLQTRGRRVPPLQYQPFHIFKNISRILHLSVFICSIRVIRVLIICPFRPITKLFTFSVVNCQLSKTDHDLSLQNTIFTLHSSLFTLHSSLFTVHCSLFTVLHSSLFTLHCSLFTVHCSSLFILNSSFFILSSSLLVLHSSLFTLHSSFLTPINPSQ